MSPWRLLQGAIVVVIFSAVIWRLDVDAMFSQIRAVAPWRIGVAIGLNIPIVILYGSRSHVVLRKLGHSLKPAILLPITILGNVAGAVTPASAGEILRGQALAGHASVSGEDSFALVLFERGLSLYMLSLGAIAAVATTTLPAWAAILITCACLLALAAPPVGARILQSLAASRFAMGAEPASIRARIFGVADRLGLVFGDIRLLTVWMAQTAAMFALSTVQFWVLAAGVSDDISYLDAWIAFSVPTLISVLSLIPLGVGAFDGSVVAALDRLGATFEQGSAVAVLVRAAISLPLLLMALASYLYLIRRRTADEAAIDAAADSVV